MVDTNLTGVRCRARTALRSHRGVIKISTEGTIQHDIENLGRRLISVEWEVGITNYVFPFEIEIVEAKNHFNRRTSDYPDRFCKSRSGNTRQSLAL